MMEFLVEGIEKIVCHLILKKLVLAWLPMLNIRDAVLWILQDNLIQKAHSLNNPTTIIITILTNFHSNNNPLNFNKCNSNL